MATNLRVGTTHGYQPYREVEPVPAYPRVDPQQPRDQYPRQEQSQRADKDDQARRRFRAMRQLIDQLKKAANIARVDYFTAEKELHDIGLAWAEKELIEQLLELKLPLEAIDQLFNQIRQQEVLPELEAGHTLKETEGFLPIFSAGLSEYLLSFKKLHISGAGKQQHILEHIEKSGRFMVEKNRLRFDFRTFGDAHHGQRLYLNISVLVAVSEMDEEGRKVLLYQRPNLSYALYADKQIDLSI